MSFTIGEIAAKIGGEVVGDPSEKITGIASADKARPGELTFAENEKYLAAAEASQATGILVSGAVPKSAKALIKVANVRVAMAQLLPIFFPQEEFTAGIHPSAVIHSSAQVEASAHVGAHCVVGARSRIGAKCVLMGGNHVGNDCEIGEASRLFQNVVIYHRTKIGKRVAIHASTVIGSDGYGYVFDQGRHNKVLQVGNVVIEDDVEIGANAAIDRGALGSTVIGAGTKVDNLVHVAHNVVMGKHVLVMGQCGFAGSTQLGDYAVIASQSGIAGHLKLGRQATVGAKSGVMRDVADGETVLGIPAQPHQAQKRQWVAVQRLPEMTKRLRELEQQVEELKRLVEGASKAS